MFLLPINLLGVGLAMISAGVWGSGDFMGGLAARRSSQYQVVALSAFSGLLVLALAALVWREQFPAPRGIVFSALGGAGGALGMVALYRALSMGHNATVAPTSAVISASLPVIFSIFTDGLPGTTKLAGFGLALVGICLVSLPGSDVGKVTPRVFCWPAWLE